MPFDCFHANGPRAYDALAPFYDRYWGPSFLDDAVRFYLQFLAPKLPKGAKVLDLCCGPGHFSAWLAAQGIQVTGIDASPAMIRLAELKAAGAEFRVADMLNLELGARFAAVVCFFNSMNQVLSRERLLDVLRSVHRHLLHGGWLLFDVVPEKAYADSWETRESVTLDGRVCELTYRYDETKRLASCEVQVRCEESGAPIARETFFQRPHPLASLVAAIHAAGFPFVEVIRSKTGSAPHSRIALLAKSDSGAAAKNSRRVSGTRIGVCDQATTPPGPDRSLRRSEKSLRLPLPHGRGSEDSMRYRAASVSERSRLRAGRERLA